MYDNGFLPISNIFQCVMADCLCTYFFSNLIAEKIKSLLWTLLYSYCDGPMVDADIHTYYINTHFVYYNKHLRRNKQNKIQTWNRMLYLFID